MTTSPSVPAAELAPGSDLEYAVNFTAAPQRGGALAVCAFAAHMRSLALLTGDAAPARFAWWHDELERARTGAPSHPVLKRVCASVDPVPLEALNEMLHAALADANRVSIEDREALERYLHLRGGALIGALEQVAGGSPASPFARAAGQLHAAVAWLGAQTGAPAPQPRGPEAGVLLRPVICDALGTLATTTRPASTAAAVLVALARRRAPLAMLLQPARERATLARLFASWTAARRHLAGTTPAQSLTDGPDS